MPSKLLNIKLWIKEFFRKCTQKKLFTNNDPPFMIIGHRGAPGLKPENTIPSFETALNEGANGIETDLVLTVDNEVVLWHDWNPDNTVALLREAGFEPFVKYKPHPPNYFSDFRKPINELTLNEIRENYFYKNRKGKLHLITKAEIPTLEDFFVWASGRKDLLYVFFDIKAPETETGCAVSILDKIVQLGQQFNPHFQIIIETFYTQCFLEMKKAYPDLTYSLDIEPPPGFILNPEDYSAVDAAVNNNNEIAISFRPRKITVANWTTFRRIVQADRKKIISMHPNGDDRIKLVAATINKKKEQRCMVRLGVDGIQTDFPGRLLKIAKKYKRKVASVSIKKQTFVL
jgi:glycerophosphoryl diester phosphodiesterase